MQVFIFVLTLWKSTPTLANCCRGAGLKCWYITHHLLLFPFEGIRPAISLLTDRPTSASYDFPSRAMKPCKNLTGLRLNNAKYKQNSHFHLRLANDPSCIFLIDSTVAISNEQLERLESGVLVGPQRSSVGHFFTNQIDGSEPHFVYEGF